jgi:hypothetical protein
MGQTVLDDDRFSFSVASCVCRPGKYGRLKRGGVVLRYAGRRSWSGQRQHGRETTAPNTRDEHGRCGPTSLLRADGDYFRQAPDSRESGGLTRVAVMQPADQG